MLVRTANGSYGTSYYLIAIESDEDINSVVDANNQTFAHEYIHFLQDIFLSYNLRQNMVELRDFRLIVQRAQSTGFSRPFEHWDDDSVETSRQFSYTWGDDAVLDEAPAIESMESEHFVIPETGARVFRHAIIFAGFGYYQFGARDLLEYIAYKIESKHWLAESPALPYLTVDHVLNFVGLETLCEKSRIVLVEVALHNDNPANQLLVMAEFIKAQFPQDSLSSYDQFSRALLSFEWNSAGGFSETLVSKTERRLNDLTLSLQMHFGHDDTSEIKRWIERVDDFVRENMQGRLFFADLYSLDGDDFFSELNRIVAEIGVPIVMNGIGEMISLLPSDYRHEQFLQLYVNRSFVDFAKDADTKCKLYDFCSASNPDIMNEDCLANPIARGSYEELCPFGKLVKQYDLHRIE